MSGNNAAVTIGEEKNLPEKKRRVQVLPDGVINQIAAGEVVERPASVVKELVENSIDAGGTEITVVIANGGRSSIEVIDNGCGLTREDALIAIQRFGTSKIESVHDLQSIKTLGFRGEALPSIASVSKFTLLSRTREDRSGIQIQIEGGEKPTVTECDTSPGTKISVFHLFFNVPARRRFLRSETTEAALVKTTLIDFACAYPQIRFRLVSEAREVLNLPPNENLQQRFQQLNPNLSRPIRVEYQSQTPGGLISITGMISQPVDAVSGSAKMRLIVNGRIVRDRLLLKALQQGHGTFLKPGRYPSGVLQIALRSEEIDVNVHPQKTEIRFRSPQAVFLSLSQAIEQALKGVSLTGSLTEAPLSTWQDERRFDQQRLDQQRLDQQGVPVRSVFEFHKSNAIIPQTRNIQAESFPYSVDQELLSLEISKMRYLGQIFGCYLLFEGGEKFIIVDMHAAHERVVFGTLKSQFQKGSVSAQLLLVPEIIAVEPYFVEAFSSAKEVFARLGFECDVFGEESIVVRAVPAVVAGKSIKALFEEICALPVWNNVEASIEKHLDQILSRLACHSSVRSGEELQREEVYALIESLEEATSKAFCPHGRPVLKEISLFELEAMFGRRQ